MDIGLHKIIDSKPFTPPRVALALPRHWQRITHPLNSCRAYTNTLSGLCVLVSMDTMEDGKNWLHVSCSYRDRLPSWEDLKTVKEIFIGPQREALQVLPKDDDYVNVHPYCLHMWAQWAQEEA